MSLVKGTAAQVMFVGSLRFLNQVQYVFRLARCEVGGRKLIPDLLVPGTDEIRRAKVKRCVSWLSMLEEELANGCVPFEIRSQMAPFLLRCLARFRGAPRVEFGANNVKRNVRTVGVYRICT